MIRRPPRSTPLYSSAASDVYKRQALHKASGAKCRGRPLSCFFQGVEQHAGDVETGLLGDFLEAGRAGDVDLGEIVADYVKANQQQSLRVKPRTECRSNFPLPL